METITHSALDAQSVRPFAFKNVEDYQDLARIGLGGFDSILDAGFGMDSIQGGVTQGSIPVQLQFLQQFLPGFVSVMTAARKIDEIIGINTAGNWEDEEIVQGIIENTGTAVPYGDQTSVPPASWNENWVPRTVVRFELGRRRGRPRRPPLRPASWSTSVGRKRESAGLALEQQRNAVGFYGYNSGNNLTYGFLNDPNLPAYKNVAATGTGSSTLWSTKNFQQITADIITAFAQLQSQSMQDSINPEDVATTASALATAGLPIPLRHHRLRPLRPPVAEGHLPEMPRRIRSAAQCGERRLQRVLHLRGRGQRPVVRRRAHLRAARPGEVPGAGRHTAHYKLRGGRAQRYCGNFMQKHPSQCVRYSGFEVFQ